MLSFTIPALARTLVSIRVGTFLRSTGEHTILEIPAGTVLEVAAIDPADDTAWLIHPEMQVGECFDVRETEYNLFPEGN